jgi:hypothetical protein
LQCKKTRRLARQSGEERLAQWISGPQAFHARPIQACRRATSLIRPAAASRADRRQEEGRQLPAFFSKLSADDYCAGAAGAGSAGFIVSVPGAGAGSVAGGLVLCVVVVSVPVPLSLQAAMPSNATADKEARMTFFMTVSFEKTHEIGAAARRSGLVTGA